MTGESHLYATTNWGTQCQDPEGRAGMCANLWASQRSSPSDGINQTHNGWRDTYWLSMKLLRGQGRGAEQPKPSSVLATAATAQPVPQCREQQGVAVQPRGGRGQQWPAAYFLSRCCVLKHAEETKPSHRPTTQGTSAPRGVKLTPCPTGNPTQVLALPLP